MAAYPLALSISMVLICRVVAFVDYEPLRFTSPQKRIADWPTLPDGVAGNIVGISAASPQGAYFATHQDLYFLMEGTWSIQKVATVGAYDTAFGLCAAGSRVVILAQRHAPVYPYEPSNQANFFTCSSTACEETGSFSITGIPSSCVIPHTADEGTIIATSEGLVYVKHQDPRYKQEWKLEGNFSAVALNGSQVMAADANRVHTFNFSDPPQNTSSGLWEWISRADGSGGQTDLGPITGITVNDARAVLGSQDQLVGIDADFIFSRYGPRQGQPINNTQLVSTAGPCCFWAAGESGLILHNATLNTWRYFSGPRWLSGSGVVALASIQGSAVVATKEGLTVLQHRTRTLAEKAAGYLSSYKRQDRHGLVSGCNLNSLGNLSSCKPFTSDNDGLWTSLHVGAAALEYQVTGNPLARERAWYHFDAMRNQSRITGVPGLPARSLCDASEAVACINGGGRWHNSTVPGWEGWVWKGDTSSDEIVGHMFAYGVMWDVFVEQRAEIASLIDSILSNIISAPYPLTLVDITGRPTRWGHWEPECINMDQLCSDERGLNSLQILSWLLLGFKATGKQEYLDQYRTLVEKYGYARNMANLKVQWPFDDNFSDDELTFLPYYTYFSSASTAPDHYDVWKFADISLDRTFSIVESERSALWGTVYAACKNFRANGSGAKAAERVANDVRWNLETWPESLVDWPAHNSQRQDVRLDPEGERNDGHNKKSFEVLPANERQQLRWNSDPFVLDGGNGRSEVDAGAVLLPYWMGRFVPGLLSEADAPVFSV